MCNCWSKCCAKPAISASRRRWIHMPSARWHRANHYDLILLDLQMPGMDGFQVMEGLKEIETDGYLPYS